jgi:signal peptidase I
VEKSEPVAAELPEGSLPPVEAAPATSANGTVQEAIPDAISAEPSPEIAQGPLPIPPPPEPPLVKVLISPTASRRLTESLIIFAGAILFLRAWAVEPFGVPTGSMAPTLIGNHKCVNCPRCGYTIRVGEPSRPHASIGRVTCPNCGQPDVDLSQSIDIAGDRLLVDKNVYLLRKPRRWEPAVFRCPSDLTKPYVKRVIGLPGERIFIFDGDIYINGKLARKTLAQCREARVPVFDMNFPPQPGGWSERWIADNEPPTPEAEVRASGASFIVGDRDLRIDGVAAGKTPYWAAYRHHRYDEATGGEKEEVLRDTFVYNGPGGEDKAIPVHDFFVSFEVEVVAGSGSLLCRMADGKDQLTASCPVGVAEDALLRHGNFGAVRNGARKPLAVGKKYRIEMAFVDRRISFAVDGDQPFAAYDLEPAPLRSDVISPFAFGVQGVNVVIRDVQLYRDIYYRSSGRNAVETPYQLANDEYFMLGDNSANSDDSRSWPIPGVPERNFLGKPFLLHQPSRVSHMTIGGRERVFQSIDWGRIRFLR